MNNHPFEFGRSQKRDKILISRLDHGPPPPDKKKIERNREDRVTRACKACRKRKVKCSGDLPCCSHCQLNSLNCVYEQARRDRLTEATHLNHALAALLQDLSGRVNNEDKQRIDDALREANDDLFVQETRSSLISLGKRSRKQSTDENDQETAPHGESHVTASAGSNENLDNLDEDLMRDRGSRATGYVGQNSEVQWLRSVQRQSEQTGAALRDQPYGPPGSSRDAASARSDALRKRRDIAKENFREGSMKHITDSTFYLDSEDIEFDIVVDPNEDPEPDVAERLFNCYLETVHPSFPLVPINFEDQFRKYLESRRQKGTLEVPRWWRAQMNLLFAIGAKYSHLVDSQWRGNERDHLLYMTRAVHLLDFKNSFMIFSVPDIHLVQATGALSFYFLAIGHVSRAWVTIGVSIRLALALGLHLRNEDPEAGEARKESLVHAWWSLHSIECLVSMITGRLPVIASEDCTVPLPHGLPAERGNLDTSRNASRKRTVYSQGHYLVAHIKITLISQEVLLRIYSPRTAAQSWEFVQNRISELLKELEEWASVALNETPRKRNQKRKPQSEREELLLTMDYWSTKMLITRPCLCRIEQRIQNESNASMDFNTTSAKDCVNAALEMVKLFPNKPDLHFIYSKGPWWAVVHLIIQAISILLLEMTYENKNVEVSNPNIHTSIKKLICWLRALQHNDPVACKAYKVVWKILKSCAPSLQSRVNDLLAFDEEVAAQPQTSPYHQSASGEKNAEPRLPGEAHRNPIDTTGNLDPQAFQYLPFTDPSLYQDNQNTFYSPDEYLSPMPFGNLFFTSFDQGLSDINMQNLWSDIPASNLYNTNTSDVEISHGHPENEPSLDTEYTPQQ